MRSLIIGLGNPIMGDDAVGCKTAQAVQARVKAAGFVDVEVDQFFRGGIALMERMLGYDRVLIIDSITGTGRQPGEIALLGIDDLPSLNTYSPHDGSLKNALEFARTIGEPVPERVDILAVEIEPKFEFSDELSSRVGASIPVMVQLALEWIGQ
jgi:hydrogenase maturation protease